MEDAVARAADAHHHGAGGRAIDLVHRPKVRSTPLQRLTGLTEP